MAKRNRKSYQALGKVYFWTATIHKWHCLLDDANKDLLIDYFKQLSDRGLITIYAFVIMPNHMHLILRQNKLNGRESPVSSLLKFTAHIFLKRLLMEYRSEKYRVDLSNKEYQIWKRDSLSVELYTRGATLQKMRYIHLNPIRGRWKLAKDDISYYYSSAMFYETGQRDFGFLKNIYLVFEGEWLAADVSPADVS